MAIDYCEYHGHRWRDVSGYPNDQQCIVCCASRAKVKEPMMANDDRDELLAHLVDDGTISAEDDGECAYCEYEAWYTCMVCGSPICHDHSVHSDGSTWCTECEGVSISNRVMTEALFESLDDSERSGGDGE